ncbi:MAG: helix-turn-helix transcriptional regulator [Clostridia bacterium]|nr:helix-turn-helix transcriptional regulator [Clostridia bacterium]
MRLKINSCGICDCLPEWQWHTDGFHDYDLWAVFRGEGTIQAHTADTVTEIAVHDGICVLLVPDTKYIAKHHEERPLLVINAHFEFLDDDGTPIYLEKLQTKILPSPLFLQELLTRMVSFYNSNDEKAALAYFAAALEEFFHAETPENSEILGIWMKIISEICTEIDSKPQTPSLSYFAKKYGYTERYIGKMFTQIKKISFSDYTQNARINKAKTLLRLTDLSVGAVAEELGYCDACHFTKNFRKMIGVSPLVYRKMQKTENI